MSGTPAPAITLSTSELESRLSFPISKKLEVLITAEGRWWRHGDEWTLTPDEGAS